MVRAVSQEHAGKGARVARRVTRRGTMDHIGSLLIGIGIVCAAFEGDIAPLICFGAGVMFYLH